MRSFFTTIADSFLEDKKVPNMNIGPENSSSIKLGNYDSVRRQSSLASISRLSRNRALHMEKSNTLGISPHADPWDPISGNKDDTKYDLKGKKTFVLVFYFTPLPV